MPLWKGLFCIFTTNKVDFIISIFLQVKIFHRQMNTRHFKKYWHFFPCLLLQTGCVLGQWTKVSFQRKNSAKGGFCITEYGGGSWGMNEFSGEPKTTPIFRGEFIWQPSLEHILEGSRGQVKRQGLMSRQLLQNKILFLLMVHSIHNSLERRIFHCGVFN